MSYARLLTPLSVPSRFLGTNRTVRVFLPRSYDTDPKKRYPVLYVHDGQNVFSSAGPDCCFGWGNWNLDGTADGLAAEGRMREIIIVAIDNSRYRYQEYRGPAHHYSKRELSALKRPPPGANDESRFENYGAFVVKELKPRIDKEFRTLKGPKDTGLMGSSLGGICSLAMAWNNPKVFGLAASLSGSFQIERSCFITNTLQSYRRKAKPIQIYVDSGIVDSSGGDDEKGHTDQVAETLRNIGWRDGKNLMHFTDERIIHGEELGRLGLRHDKWHEAETSQHNEFYWRHRVWRPLIFLFPPE